MTRQKRPTVYYALSCLERRGLISKTGKEGIRRFAVEPLQHLETIVEGKTKEVVELMADVKNIIPLLGAREMSFDKRPRVAFFEGAEAVKNVIMGSIYCREKQIDSVVPRENFFWQIGKVFVSRYVEARIERRIKTRNLWEQPIEKAIVEKYYQGLSEIRIVPPIMRDKFLTTVFLYDDKTLYVSSLKNGYCIQIVSQEHHDTMKAWFDGLWAGSKVCPISK